MDVKLTAFRDALAGFRYLAELDLLSLAEAMDPRLIDGLENGLAQKFEITVESAWKAAKVHMAERHGQDLASPKVAFKALYLSGGVTEAELLSLLSALDDRNRFSHAYDPIGFREILERVRAYVAPLALLCAMLEGPSP